MNRNEGVYVNVESGPHVQQQAMAPPATNSATRSPKEKYKSVLYSMGTVEIITGSLSVILGVITIIIAASNHGYYPWRAFSSYQRFYYDTTYSAQGIWGGVFSIVVGIVGVKTRSNPSQCMYNANMALSIIGANVMGIFTIISGVAAGSTSPRLPGLIAVHSILALLGFVGMVIMIIHSAYCCAGICCNNRSHQGVRVSYYPGHVGIQQPQLVQLANGQYMLAPTQAIVAPYPMTQVPMVGGAVAYQQPAQSFVPTQVPVNQYYQAPGLQTHVAPAPSAMNMPTPQAVAPAPLAMNIPAPQAVVPVAQQVTVDNPQQAAQVGKDEEENANPPGYSTLPRSE